MPVEWDDTGGVDAQAEVCVVGAGPAGLTVAEELRGSGLRVVVLESGGTAGGEHDAGTDDAAAFEEGRVPWSAGDLSLTRGRGLGGTATRWSFALAGAGESLDAAPRGARHAPLDEIDLERRAAVPHSGWPMTRADLDPWYARAHEIAGLGAYDYTSGAAELPDARPLPLDPSRIRSGVFRFGPASTFTVDLPARMDADADIRIVRGCTVVDLGAPAGGRPRRVRGRRPDGTPFTVAARIVVLATGAIETARLLLVHERVHGGLSEVSNWLGRGLMEHPLVRGGRLHMAPGPGPGRRLGFYDLRRTGDSWVLGRSSLAPELLRSEDLLNMSALLVPAARLSYDPGVVAWQMLRQGGPGLPGRERTALLARSILSGPRLLQWFAQRDSWPSLDRTGWSRAGLSSCPALDVYHQTEQVPDRRNRVELGSTVDGLGQPRPVLTWRWSDRERDSVLRGSHEFGRAFEAAGLGRFEPVRDRHWSPVMLGGSHHHMGTTRMSATAADGVVDPDCAVHGMPDVYVAGAAVFPTGGYVNPTLTVIALAARVGAHLRGVLGAPNPTRNRALGAAEAGPTG